MGAATFRCASMKNAYLFLKWLPVDHCITLKPLILFLN